MRASCVTLENPPNAFFDVELLVISISGFIKS